ncbi:N-myc-interactor [Triplophysa dalaica]|uniref:N-myc-interactor n=1 Tax=Triplophysa dalaica TaxID=1582913 RepID=UPI0024DFEE85|nr:N-myc-interactor [Triplophysa dalaica]XP_056611153.1 N-myc-interactor [Triplophysa dalaica]
MSDSAADLLNGEPEILVEEKMSAAAEELQKYKDLIQCADDERSRLLLEKMEAEDGKKKAQKEFEDLAEIEHKLGLQFKGDLDETQEQRKNLDRVKLDLQRELQDLQNKLDRKKAETASLQQKFKIKAEIPVKRMKFTQTEAEEKEDRDEDVTGVFTVTQRPSFLLKGGQALITFEEENVADQILRLAKCSVACDKIKMDVKPYSLTLEPSVKFEVHIKVSKKTIKFRNAPPTLPEERMTDRLEISFSKASRGGGEVESVDYDQQNGTGHVTFVHTGVAENLVLRKTFSVDTGSDVKVDVLPLYEYQLKKFQTYSGVPNHTVLLGGIQDLLDEEDLQDHLEIHFQKPSNYGGEVQAIKYVPTGRSLTAFFNEAKEETDG